MSQKETRPMSKMPALLNIKSQDDAFNDSFDTQDVEIVSKKILYRGFFSFVAYQFRHKLFKGGVSELLSREMMQRDNAAGLLAYDAMRDTVVLIEQIRVGALEEDRSPWLIEIIAGIIDKGESIEQVVRREAKEEAGIDIGRCLPMLSYLATPGGCNERLSLMVGEVDSRQAKGIHGLATEHEDIRVHVLSREDAYHWVENGKIDNAASVIALQWLQLNYKKLQITWSE